MEKTKIEVKKIGENPGFCREYYKSKSGMIVARTLALGKWPEEWHTCGGVNGGEPECPINTEKIDFVILEA